VRADRQISAGDIRMELSGLPDEEEEAADIASASPGMGVEMRNETQAKYLREIEANEVTLGIGPAGTGKTYLAVAAALAALERRAVKRVVFSRPVVEAGESLGFLPGDLEQKVSPYLRPLDDAIREIAGRAAAEKLAADGLIEIAPLAYMRGRTLTDAFAILDEGQNTTVEQMKMFLTRMGSGTRMVVTGDVTQVDLPRNVPSGLADAQARLAGVKGISVVEFQAEDIVRHPVVRRIIAAYAERRKGA